MASLLLEPNTFGEKAQENGKHDLHSAWRGIGVDDNKMAALGKAIGEIVNSQDQVPDQLRKAATTILEISSALNATMIPLSLLPYITNPFLISHSTNTKRVSVES